MKTGKLNRLWLRGKDFFEKNRDTLKKLIVVICVIIAIILVVGDIMEVDGGFKSLYAYDEQEYIQLENLLKEKITEDPYLDLQIIEDSNFSYKCNYDSKQNSWMLIATKENAEVTANVSVGEDGTLNIETSYTGKIATWVWNTVALIAVLALIAFLLYCAFYLFAHLVIGLFWFVCLGEKVVILIKKSIKNKKNNNLPK